MPLTALEQNTVSRSFFVAKKVLEEVKPVLDALNIIYDAGGGVKETLTQAELDEIPAFSGLTKTQLDDGLYALTAVIRPAITNAFTALAQLATRA